MKLLHYMAITPLSLCLLGGLLAFSTPTLLAQVDGGMVSNLVGSEIAYTCPGDGVADLITLTNTSTSAATYQYLVTNGDDTVLALPPANMVELDGAGVGNCKVYGLSYTGSLLVMPGDHVPTLAAFSDADWELSSNYFLAIRDQPDTAVLNFAGGGTSANICAGDGVADPLTIENNSASQAAFRYLITDAAGNILGTPEGDVIDLEGAGLGTCLVYGLSFTGNFTAAAGMNVHSSSMLSDDCFALSSNSVAIVRDSCTVDGGTVSDLSGNEVVWTCPGDGIPDEIFLTNSGTGTGSYQYLVTDANDTLLALPPSNMVELEGAGTGNCKVYGLSFTGNLSIVPGDHIPSISVFSDGLFDLSDNFLLTVRDQPDTAMINIVGDGTSTTICAGDGISDLLFIENNSASQAQFRYLITDGVGNILGTPPGNDIDLEGAGPGTCLVYGLSFTGNFTAVAGMNVHSSSMLSDDCFALSANSVAINRIDCSSSCTAPINLDATPIGSEQVVASWDPVPGALAYQLQAKVDGEFRKNNYFLGTTATYNVLPGRTYEYRVRAICLADPSPYSAAFTYSAPAARLAAESATQLQAHPSLFQSQLRIVLPLLGPSAEGLLQVVDMTGRVVFSRNLASEQNTLELASSDWPSGAYRVVWQADGATQFVAIQKQ